MAEPAIPWAMTREGTSESLDLSMTCAVCDVINDDVGLTFD